uniref:Globin domain-containing protein n=1 Tax=Amphiprion percula TaxID=161767 RepID=A0A3P8TKI7_AMPPE
PFCFVIQHIILLKEVDDWINSIFFYFWRLFDTHLECKDAFLVFRDIDDLETLRNNRELRAHSLSIMSFIEKTVARIDQDELLFELILDLGKKHYQYNVLPKYYQFMGAEFIQAVQPVLKERWSSDLEAWKTNLTELKMLLIKYNRSNRSKSQISTAECMKSVYYK